MEDRRAAALKWANPENQELDTSGQVMGTIATLPAQIPGMLGSAAEKGMDLVKRGESLSRAIPATAIEAGMTAAGMGPMAPAKSFMGRAAIGAASNMALGAGADAATQLLAEQASTKQAYDPYNLDKRLVEGLAGGITQGIMGERPTTKSSANKRLDNIRADAQKPQTPDVSAWVSPEQLRLFDQFEERSHISPYQTEMAPDMWRTDENGIPIRADLSMEVQNMQQPLQRNLFGDELDVNFPRDPNKPLTMDGDIPGAERFSEPVNFRNDPENQRPLTEAIDSMEPSARTAALEQTKMGRELPADGPMEAAKMQADIAAASGDNFKGFNAKMRKQGGGLLIDNKKVVVEATKDGFVAKIGDKEVGYLRSNITPEQRAQLGEDASVDMVKVQDDIRGKGVGKALYEAWSKANEGNVIPSGKTSPAAWKQWKRNLPGGVDKFVNQEAQRILGGADPQLILGNIPDPEVAQRVQARAALLQKQSGGVLIDWKNKNKADVLSKVAGIKEKLKAFIPTEMDAAGTIELARQAKDVDQSLLQKGINLFTKGGLYQAEKTGNPIVKFTVDKVLNADRKARADVRDFIHDSLAPAMRALPEKDMVEIASILNDADLNKYEITPELLRKHGLSEQQIAFAQVHRETMDKAFESINKARAAADKPPIEKRISYAAMAATGDYRKVVHQKNADGEMEVVGVIGANTRRGLANIEAKLQGKGYEFGKERFAGGGSRKGASDVQAVMDALEHLAENNPNTKTFLDVLSDLKTQEAYSFVNAQKHTKAKKGVFGMEGRKQWQTDLENAKDFMDAQLRYAESAIRWGHLSDAATEIKQVLSSDVDQPNAKVWAEKYFQNALGINPSETGRHLEKAVDSVLMGAGIGTTIPRNIQGYSRKIVNTLLLGLNPAFLATNVIQPLMSMPAMNTFLKGRGLDETGLLTMGYDSMAQAGFTLMKERLGKLSPLEKAASKYAKENHVFGTDLVDTSSVSRKNAEFYLDKTGNFLASNVESATRQMMYYAFVHMLDKNGMGKEFGLAQNLTDTAMNNYSPVERPQVFNALGPIGDLAANLSSFKHNELSRMAMFAREIGKSGDARPLLTQLAMGVAAAGITGSLAFAEADWLYRQLSKAMGKPDSLTRVAMEFSEKAAASVGSDKGKYALSHGVFSFLGLDLSKRLGVSDVIPNSLGEAMFPGGSKLVDVAGAGLSAITDPSELNAKRFAREAAPGVLTGPMDRAWFSKDTPEGELAVNRRTLEGQLIRTKADKMAKNIGFTGINESVQKQKLWDLKQQGIGYAELRSAVVKKMAEQMYSKGTFDPKLTENYAKYEGDVNSLTRELETKVKAQQMSMVDAVKLKALATKTMPQQAQAVRTIESLQ